MTYKTSDLTKQNIEEFKLFFLNHFDHESEYTALNFFNWLYKSEYCQAQFITKLLYHYDEIIGYGSVLLFEIEDYKVGSLVNLFIEEKHRTLGPAIQLQKSLLHKVKEEALCDFILAKPNLKSEAVFKRMGYQCLGPMTRHTIVLNPLLYLQIPSILPRIDGFLFQWMNVVRFYLLLISARNKSQNEIKKGCFIEESYIKQKLMSSFRSWRYFNIFSNSNYLYKVKKGVLKEDGYIIYSSAKSIIYIEDLINIDQDDLEEVLLTFLFSVCRKDRLKAISFSFLSNKNFSNAIKELDFIERVDGNEQNIYFYPISKKIDKPVEVLNKISLYPTNLDF